MLQKFSGAAGFCLVVFASSNATLRITVLRLDDGDDDDAEEKGASTVLMSLALQPTLESLITPVRLLQMLVRFSWSWLDLLETTEALPDALSYLSASPLITLSISPLFCFASLSM